MITFLIHWRDGREETITGDDIADAMNKAGIGSAEFIKQIEWFKPLVQ